MTDHSILQLSKAVFPAMGAQPFHRTYYDVLDRFAQGQIRRLIVTMPPQHGKSHGSSVLLPAYLLGLDPDRKIAIASYSSSLANRFNRRVQRIIDTPEYAEMFPHTRIKTSSSQGSYIRTADHVEIIDHEGELFSVGREGPLTGNRVDTFILDDLYKDAMEANSPIVRENCWEWYTSVVRTRMHNDSSELIVFTRWHQEDLIGTIAEHEDVVEFTSMDQIATLPEDAWLHLNFEAIKTSEATPLDPRPKSEALWPERHSARLLMKKRLLDPPQFECMYQGHPTPAEGLLYGAQLQVYSSIPLSTTCRANYTDTADTGEDYLCSVCYEVGQDDGLVYITDVVYTTEPMEITERAVAQMLTDNDTREAFIESNNGGRGFARAVGDIVPHVKIDWFHQSDNKEARILTNPAFVFRPTGRRAGRSSTTT